MAAATTTALAGAAGSAEAKRPERDTEFDAIENRMLDLGKRGTTLSTNQKYFVLLAVATAVAAEGGVRDIAERALRDKVPGTLIREAIFQTSPYVGLARAKAALREAFAAFRHAGVKVEAKGATVNDQNRFEKGLDTQGGIFGRDHILKMHESAAEGEKGLIVDDLTAWCFGDYYTRENISIKDRELITFASIAALGGCEPQLKAHIAANLSVGATKQNLTDALRVADPLLGFPRTLNALGLVRAAK